MSRDGHGVDLKANKQMTSTTGKLPRKFTKYKKNVPLLSVRVRGDPQYKRDVTDVSFNQATIWKCHQIKPPNPNGTVKIESLPI